MSAENLAQSERQELAFESITFYEETQGDGSLSVTWDKCSTKTWHAVLEAIKTMIPKGYRVYDNTRKVWTISSSYLDTWQDIVLAFSDEANIGLRQRLEEQVAEEAAAEMLHRGTASLPPSMKKRALFALRAVLGLADTELEYSFARDEFGAWNPDEKSWNYTDGRYSATSPRQFDLKQRKRTQDRITKAIEAIPELLAQIENEAEFAWKARFRSAMLQKYSYQCYACGLSPDSLTYLHMHRVIPGKDGGEYIEDNVVILCASCHHHLEGASWDEIRQAANTLGGVA